MLTKTIVGYSSSDIEYYYSMLAWKHSEGIDFHFADCGLTAEAVRYSEKQVKERARQIIEHTGKYALLIGEDTWFRCLYIQWEAEIALERGCTIIGVNLDGARQIVERKCPEVIKDIGAAFVPFSPRIMAYALVNFRKRERGNWHFPDTIYRQLGYDV